MKCFKTPNASYTNRYAQADEKMNLLQKNIINKCHRTNSTFAIRTSQRSNPKLQKSYFLPTPQKQCIFEKN